MAQPAAARIAHLVLTGGPCAGKTSALAYLTEELTARGWRVLSVPEAATLLIAGGAGDLGTLAGTDRAAYLAVQEQLVGLQVDLHARYEELGRALGARRTVLLHDRGVVDNAAYMSAEEYAATVTAAGLDAGADHGLYDAVLHLRSAAVPSGSYDGSGYTRENNAARFEDAAAAARLDESTLAAWSGHPHLTVIGSSGTFAAKLERTLAAALTALGDPEPLEIERKFTLAGPPDLTHPRLAGAVTVHIEQVYLHRLGADEHRIRARTLDGVTTYTHATKTDRGDGARVEVETPIDAQTYTLLSSMRDTQTRPISKTRYLFVEGNQRFELDHLHAPREAWLLEAELVTSTDHVDLPDFLPVDREVTDDPAWRNRHLATATT